jgi:peptidoglycan/LPS O-acetylase OafA/YrhL
MLLAVFAQTRWQALRILVPLLRLGQRSYEIYLTHVFVVLGFFSLFVAAGKPMRYIPALFIVVILIAALVGELVARGYSEPMNRWLRQRWGDGPRTLGSVIPSVRLPKTRDNQA